MKKRIEFICPECNEESYIEEINEGLIYYELHKDDEKPNQYWTQTNPEEEPWIDLEKTIGYCCKSCGCRLRTRKKNNVMYGDPITNPKELNDWLEKRKMLKEE